MGFLFNSDQEASEKIRSELGDLNNHLLTLKHNDVETDSFERLVSGGLCYTADSIRTLTLYPSSKGIHEEEISNSVERDFLLIPWHEISSPELKIKENRTILRLVHIERKVDYEIPFEGVTFRDNKEDLQEPGSRD